MAVTVQDLIADTLKPACVHRDAMAVEALRLMMAQDYSQLPIVDDDEQLVGMITTDSIARALNLLGVTVRDLKVSNALQTVKEYRLDSELSELLEGLRDTYAVPVVDNFSRVIGIITNYDTAAFFRSRAEDMMDVEDVENMLKDCLRIDLVAEQGQLDDSELKEKISNEKGVKTFDRMSFNDYLILFFYHSRWSRIEKVVDLQKDACRRMFLDVRDVRNDLFHFRTDISAERRYSLKYCRDWLNRHQQAIMDALRPAEARQEKPATIESLADEKGVTPEELTGQKEALAENPQIIEKATAETSKYEGIATFLQTLPQHVDNVEVSFEEVEAIIEGELPRAAYEHRSWWANDSAGHVQSRQWLEVGWRVSSVNITHKRATFSRVKDREQKYIEFFSALLSEARAKGLELRDFSPSGKSFLPLDAIRTDEFDKIGFFSCSFARRGRFRIEVYIDSSDYDLNMVTFNRLESQRHAIESQAGLSLDWEGLEDKRAFRIAAYQAGSITDSPGKLENLCTWGAGTLQTFYQTFTRENLDKWLGDRPSFL